MGPILPASGAERDRLGSTVTTVSPSDCDRGVGCNIVRMLRELVRVGVSALALVACGAPGGAAAGPSSAEATALEAAASESERSAQTVELAPRPVAGVRYEILHHEARQIDDEPATSIATRTLLEIIEVLPDGARRARARLFRTDQDEGEEVALADEIVAFDLSATGALVGEPERRCGGSGELRLARYLRHVLGARAIVAQHVGEGSEWRSSFPIDLTELPAQARFRLDEVRPDEAEGSLSAAIVVEDGDLGSVRVTGEGRLRGRFIVSLSDGFSGTTELRTEIEGTIVSSGSERRGVVRTRARVRVRQVDREESTSLSCDFEPASVPAAIRERIEELQTCYERELANDPNLQGRVLVQFTVEPSGRFTDVVAIEDSLGTDAVAACVVALLGTTRVPTGPRSGTVTFAYPLIFAPERESTSP